MPRPVDDSDHKSTLPQPDLNPMLNPLLSQHMGRWAEVYFTSPPEKREEAVLGLLRELESEPQSQAQPPASEPYAATEEKSGKKFYDPSASSENARVLLACEACGGKNLAEQRFCGMCGVPLKATSETAADPEIQNFLSTQFFSMDHPVESHTVEDPKFEDQRIENPPINHRRVEDYRREPLPVAPEIHAEPVSQNPVEYFATPTDNHYDNRYEGARGRKLDDIQESPNALVEAAPAPYRYRAYVGAAVTMALFALIYMVWHGAPARHVDSGPQPQTSATQAAIQPKSTPTPNPSAKKTTATASQSAALPITRASAPASSLSDAGANVGEQRSHSAALLEGVPADTQILPAGQSNGSDELAVAENYLNGTQGKERDSSEAVKWLWRSVSKENAAATLLLSDLYRKGEGVPQSCDQARILLDAAARKNIPGADERLRQLQTSGCQ